MTLIDYLRNRQLRPYAEETSATLGLSVGRQHLGDIARGLKKPSLDLALEIEQISGGQVTVRELLDFYQATQRPVQEEVING